MSNNYISMATGGPTGKRAALGVVGERGPGAIVAAGGDVPMDLIRAANRSADKLYKSRAAPCPHCYERRDARRACPLCGGERAHG